MNWHQYPLLRLLIPYLTGVLVAVNLNLPANTELICLLSISILFAIFLAISFLPHALDHFLGIAVGLLFISLGVLRTFQHCEVYSENHFKKYIDSSNIIIAILSEPVSEKPNSIKAILGLKAILHDNKWIKCSGRLMCYFKKDSLADQLKRGDEIILSSNIKNIAHPSNPGEFNYQKYLFNRNIFQQVYVKSTNWKKLTETENGILTFADKARDKLLSIFKDNQLQGDEFAVISALLLGYQDKIDQETLRNFSGAGIVHILSVSGLHVGIIFMVLSYLLSFLNKTSRGSKFRIVLIMLIIWLYALITGLSPPILRSAFMFSMILFAELLDRKSTIYQSILISLFVLLLINPFFLFDTGFQLSYLAVIGIVFFQKPIVNLFSPKYRILKMAWQLTAVSIAAQLATLPLTLLYFHQFPTYFIIANLIAIPYTNVLMFMGIAVICFSPMSLISNFMGAVLAKCLMWFNDVISYVNLIPFSSIQNIHFDVADALILAIIIMIMAIGIEKRNLKVILPLIIFIFIFSTKQLIEKISISDNKNITVYCIKNHTAIAFTNGSKCSLITDSSINQQSSFWKMNISNNLIDSRISAVSFLNNNMLINENTFRYNNLIQFYDTRICIEDSSVSLQKHDAIMPVDLLVITQKTKKNIERILYEFQPKQVVADASISPFYTNKWLLACKKASIKFFDVKTEGAFRMDIK